MFTDQLCGGKQHLRAFCAAAARPHAGIKGVARGLNGGIGIFGGAGRIAADRDIVRRAIAGEKRRCVSLGPFAIDEHLELMCFCRQQWMIQVNIMKKVTHTLPLIILEQAGARCGVGQRRGLHAVSQLY